jgi:type III secretion protein J
MFNVKVAKLVFLGLLAVLSGCSRTVATDIHERDATEIAVALRNQGIASTRSMTDSKKWAVSVDSNDWGDATSVMLSAGLPRAETQGYAELLKKDSMISSPSTEKAKLLFAASNELSRSLQDIDGVVSARVHLVIPDKDPFREKQRNSSASVLIKHSSEIKPADLEPAVRSFVSRSAEGLTPETVSITFVAARPVQVVRDPNGASSSNKRFTTIALALAAAGILGFLAWLIYSRQSKAKPDLTTDRSKRSARAPNEPK